MKMADRVLEYLAKQEQKEQPIREAQNYRMAWLLLNCANYHKHPDPHLCAYLTMYGSPPEVIERKYQKMQLALWDGEAPTPNLPPMELPTKKPPQAARAAAAGVKRA
jgi:hypothetical protein